VDRPPPFLLFRHLQGSLACQLRGNVNCSQHSLSERPFIGGLVFYTFPQVNLFKAIWILCSTLGNFQRNPINFKPRGLRFLIPVTGKWGLTDWKIRTSGFIEVPLRFGCFFSFTAVTPGTSSDVRQFWQDRAPPHRDAVDFCAQQSLGVGLGGKKRRCSPPRLAIGFSKLRPGLSCSMLTARQLLAAWDRPLKIAERYCFAHIGPWRFSSVGFVRPPRRTPSAVRRLAHLGGVVGDADCPRHGPWCRGSLRRSGLCPLEPRRSGFRRFGPPALPSLRSASIPQKAASRERGRLGGAGASASDQAVRVG